MPQSRSNCEQKNPLMVSLARPKSIDNLEWCSRAIQAMEVERDKKKSLVVLLGGIDVMSFRLRVAQSHLRNDMLPSYFSDAIFLKGNRSNLTKATAVNVPLLQPSGGVFATDINGVIEQPFSNFADPEVWPNIAIIALPAGELNVVTKINAFTEGRSHFDALEHVLRWLAFAWGVARTPNPIHDGVGLPSASMLETVFAGAGFDLTPGLESRASCPESIWAAAMHWHKYYLETDRPSPVGRYVTDQKYRIDDKKDKKR